MVSWFYPCDRLGTCSYIMGIYFVGKRVARRRTVTRQQLPDDEVPKHKHTEHVMVMIQSPHELKSTQSIDRYIGKVRSFNQEVTWGQVLKSEGSLEITVGRQEFKIDSTLHNRVFIYILNSAPLYFTAAYRNLSKWGAAGSATGCLG